MQWQLKSTIIPKSLTGLEKILLSNRGIESKKKFFYPIKAKDLKIEEVGIDQNQLKIAVRRIKQAIKNQEKVLIFGDYDADGIAATAILWETFRKLGLIAIPFIPNREKHGYGISKKALTELFQENEINLIITVDNGIVAHQAIEYAISQGVDVIITDHHQAEDKIPQATAIIHSTQLCGATVAWFLARALDKNSSEQSLDLAAIATIADQVPLTAANRSFAKYGLEALKKSKRTGLKALYQVAGIDKKSIDEYTVSFAIAPRINAMGRLADGIEALRLLCSKNQQRTSSLAVKLDTTNQNRQDLTYGNLEKLEEQAALWEKEKIIITHSIDYHEGVIGLIAGKLTEKYSKPSIVISIKEKISKASARSIKGINIIKLIRKVRDELLDLGGHKMAAGFSFETKKLELVKEKFLELANQEIDLSLLTPSLSLDCQLPTNLLNEKLIKLITKFAPFGQGNFKPLFKFNNLEIIDILKMGKNSQHLKLKLLDKNQINKQMVESLAWNKGKLAEKFKIGDQIELAASVGINVWNGRRNIQLKALDFKLSSVDEQ
ncbi:MAG: single-stranded-DNA-specific exonuclease RecJ [Candidatus Woesebacteria bacterium]|jgi:single-stranded-DNA-specific exonuclease